MGNNACLYTETGQGCSPSKKKKISVNKISHHSHEQYPQALNYYLDENKGFVEKKKSHSKFLWQLRAEIRWAKNVISLSLSLSMSHAT